MKRWLSGFVLAAILATPAVSLAVRMDGREYYPPGESAPHPWPPGGISGAYGPLTGGASFPAYDTDALAGARYLRPAHLGVLNVNVAMRMQNERGLLAYAQAASDPHSLYYRRFLTPRQLGDFFGASPSDYARAILYFWSYGLGVQGWAQRQMIRVVGPQAAMERALGTHFGLFSKNGVTFYAPVSAPRLSAQLAVRALGGVVTYRHMRKHFAVGMPFRPATGVGAGFLVGYSPFDLAAAFDYTGAYSFTRTCCKGDGITIGIVGTGPISSADVPFFRSVFGAAGTGKVTQVNVNQVFAACCYSSGLTTPPPVTGPCSGPLPSCNPEDVEAQLDTEQSSSLAPDAQVNFYLAYNPHECYTPGPCAGGSPQLGIGETDDELQQIVHDNAADVVSGSYGIGELDYAGVSGGLLNANGTGYEPDIFASMIAEGMAVFFSSGDTGAAGCQQDGNPATANVLCTGYPSGDRSIVSMGGTTTPIGTNGRLSGLITTWGVQTQTFGASGGGFSQVISRPPWQPVGSICADDGTSCDATHRLQPDVSLNADLVTGDAVIINCGTGASCAGLGGPLIGVVGGTSAAAPDMAAMWALVLEACNQTTKCRKGPAAHPYRLGNPAPLLYGLSAGQKAAAFYDVVYGLNAVPQLGTSYATPTLGFNAGPGWDAATGLGAPFARKLLEVVVSSVGASASAETRSRAGLRPNAATEIRRLDASRKPLM